MLLLLFMRCSQDLSPPAPITRQKPLTRAEKDVILQETIARQQKLMAKAQGIELDNDDPAAVSNHYYHMHYIHTTVSHPSTNAATASAGGSVR
jgi:hypothetical protein